MKTCLIAGAGPLFGPIPSPADGGLIIAADGGYAHLWRVGLRPDLVIGDFDSLPEKPEHPHVTELARDKDDTDMLAAVKYGLEQGCQVFHIYGGTGGRLDHTMANVQVLAYLARHGARGVLHGEGFAVTCVRNGEMTFDRSRQGTISVFAHSDTAQGVCLEGLKYELRDATLTNGCPLGVSNEFAGTDSRVSVRDGTLIVMWAE